MKFNLGCLAYVKKDIERKKQQNTTPDYTMNYNV